MLDKYVSRYITEYMKLCSDCNKYDVYNYLKGKGYQNLKTESSHIIDNKHSTELFKSWEFTYIKNKHIVISSSLLRTKFIKKS